MDAPAALDDISESEPFAPFQRWFEAAGKTEPAPDAMTLATAAQDGAPSLRAVLLKGVDDRGFVFYTNLESRKAEELFANPRAALCFLWKSLLRQVRIEGVTELVHDDEADAYFASRSRASQIGAWASEQSRPLASRDLLERRVDVFTRRFAEKPVVLRPANWSGFRLHPQRIEFWQERPSRLHDRIVFIRDRDGDGDGEAWRRQRLFP